METNDYFLYTILALTLGGFLILIIFLFVIPSGPWTSKCSSSRDCLNTEVCTDGGCKLVISQPCSKNSECESGLCSDNLCTINSNIDSIPVKFRPIPTTTTTTTTIFIQPPKIVPNKVEYPPFSENEYQHQLCSPAFDYIVESENSNTPQLGSCYSDEEISEYEFNLGPPMNQDECNELFEKSNGGGHYPTNEDSGIVDVINYSDSILYLYSDGRIRKHNQYISTGHKFSSFVVYDGYLIGLSKSKLYRLSTETYENSEWKFKPFLVDTKGSEIMRIRSTLDGNYLSIQTSDKLITIGTSGSRDIMDYNINTRRIYGYSIDKYIDINVLKKSGIDYLGKNYENIVDAIIDYDGNIKVLTVQFALKNSYAAMRIVNWEPYYLRNT